MKYSLCIEPLFPDLDFYDRIKMTADLGFEAFEFWSPADRDISRIAHLAQANHLSVAIFCAVEAWQCPANGPRDLFLRNLEKSFELAKDLDCHSLILLSGNGQPGDPAPKQRIIDNLKSAAQLAEKAGVTLCLETLNSRVDHAGYFLDSALLGFDILRQVGSPYVRLLYDIYHMQIMEGNLIATIQANAEYIGHFHSAGVPGRHEHFKGENDYPNIVRAIEAAGYTGFFGLEYWPTYDHQASVKDVRVYLEG